MRYKFIRTDYSEAQYKKERSKYNINNHGTSREADCHIGKYIDSVFGLVYAD